MSKHTPLGPGTVSVKVGTGTTQSFAAECKGAAIGHEYDEVGDAVTYLDGSTRGVSATRADTFTAEIDNDLAAGGLYAYLQANDLKEATLEYCPNTANGAKWSGTVVLRLPGEIGADEFGSPIASDVEWPAVGTLTFTAGTAPATQASA